MLRTLVLCVLVTIGSSAAAQDTGARAPILTLNQERLYVESEFGQRVRAQLDADSTDLAAENRRIETALIAEESQLTQDRVNMDPGEFRLLAEDFDERVTGIRGAQTEKREALQRIATQERSRFFELAYPVLFELVEETGALAILNQSAVILSARQIDVTEIAIDRVNAAFGASALPQEPSAAPLPRPTQEPEQAPTPSDN